MWRSSRAAAGVAALILVFGGCGAVDPPPPEGLTTDAALLESDPVGALRKGLDQLADVSAPPELEPRARALLALLARDAFDPWPDARGRLRVDLLYVMNPPEPGDRAEALVRARALAATLR